MQTDSIRFFSPDTLPLFLILAPLIAFVVIGIITGGRRVILAGAALLITSLLPALFVLIKKGSYEGLLLFSFLYAILYAIWLIPSFIAFKYNHPQPWAVMFLNIGLTLIGWFVFYYIESYCGYRFFDRHELLLWWVLIAGPACYWWWSIYWVWLKLPPTPHGPPPP